MHDVQTHAHPHPPTQTRENTHIHTHTYHTIHTRARTCARTRPDKHAPTYTDTHATIKNTHKHPHYKRPVFAPCGYVPSASRAATCCKATSLGTACWQVFLFTDGEVSNTRDVVAFCADTFRETGTRVFSFGIGAGASRALVTGVAEAGKLILSCRPSRVTGV